MASSVLTRSASQLASCRLACSSPNRRAPEAPTLVIFGQLVSPPPPFRVFRGIAQRMGHRNSLPRGVLGVIRQVPTYGVPATARPH